MNHANQNSEKTAAKPILAQWRNASPAKLLMMAGKNISKGCDVIRHRAVAMFYLQLLTGLWWEIVKIYSAENAKKKKDPGQKKAAPIESSYLSLKAENPAVFSMRTFNGWGEALLMGGQAEGWLALPTRTGRKKQARPEDATPLRKITDKHIRALAKKYKNLTRLRQVLRPAAESKSISGREPSIRTGESVLEVLAKAVVTIKKGEMTSDCLPLLRQLGLLADEAAKKFPTHESSVHGHK